MRDIGTLEEALEVSELIDAVTPPAYRARMAGALAGGQGGILRGLLAAKLDSPAGREFSGYLRDSRRLDSATLVDRNGMSVQRHFFYADDDGVESYQSFERIYRADPAWRWTDRGTWVHVAAGRVEILANKPMDADGQGEISRALAARGISPAVVVHRGHSYFVERSLRYLNAGTRLVFLGSCRGLGVTAEAMAAAPRAQLIVTRGVGTLSVNDPLLKAINDELRKGRTSIDWGPFWREQRSRFKGSPVFEDYIAPPDNHAARFVAGYYAWLRGS